MNVGITKLVVGGLEWSRTIGGKFWYSVAYIFKMSYILIQTWMIHLNIGLIILPLPEFDY